MNFKFFVVFLVALFAALSTVECIKRKFKIIDSLSSFLIEIKSFQTKSIQTFPANRFNSKIVTPFASTHSELTDSAIRMIYVCAKKKSKNRINYNSDSL